MKFALTAAPYLLGASVPVLFQGPMETTLRTAAELGFQGVELHLRDPHDIDRRQLAQRYAQYGLQAPAIGTGWAAAKDGLTFTHPDPEVRQAAVQRICDHLELAAELGSAVILGLILGNLGKEESQRPLHRQHLLASLAACSQRAAQLGVALLLEPVNRYESDHLNTLEDAQALVTELGSAGVHLLADTFHMNIEETSLAASLRRFPPAHVHLADSNRRAPGYGHLDFRSVVQALAETGYAGYLSFEFLAHPDPAQAARDGCQHVLDILRELQVAEG